MNAIRKFAAVALFLSITVALRGQARGFIREQALPISIRHVARKAGQRFLVPGKERSVVTGTIARGTGSPARIQITREMPGRIRIEEGSKPALGVSGNGLWKADGALTPNDEALLETFLDDSLEEFLIGQAGGMPTRFLGAGYRTDGGRAASYTGPYYELHQTFASASDGRSNNQPPKTFFINSETGLLEQVRYRVMRVGRTAEVFVQLANWQKFDGEWMPTIIQRYEDCAPVLTLKVSAATFSPTVNDGLFERP
jgi:hypothetical protein